MSKIESASTAITLQTPGSLVHAGRNFPGRVRPTTLMRELCMPRVMERDQAERGP
jgi:hypothetical protein